MTQAQKNQRLAISLAVLLAATAAVTWLGGRSPRAVDKTRFKTDRLDDIDQVDLVYNGLATSLRYDGSRWKVNDSLEADRQMITVLFATLDQLEAKRPVAAAQRDSLASALRTSGIRATCYARNQVVADWYLGGNSSKTLTYLMKAEDTEPFVVSIPGYRVYVAGIFEQTPSQWRDKRVFHFNWRNFTGLEARFPKEPEQNFSVAMKERYFGIEDIEAVDTTRLNDYLDALSLLEAESFYTPGQSRLFDSLLQVPPSFVIEVKDLAKRSYRLEVAPPVRASDKVVGKLGNEPALFLKRDLVKIAKKRAFFAAGETTR
jgi:hypothetical protein